MLTAISNLVPFALFDVAVRRRVAAFAVLFVARRFGSHGGMAARLACGRLGRDAAAVVYLVFLATWGLNYRRVPLMREAAFDAARVTPQAAARARERARRELNAPLRGRPRAHAARATLAAVVSRRAARARRAAPIVPGRPKATLLGGYFHDTAIAGMTDPFFLETMIAPDLLDVERPFVIAHEWAHLAGYADESEANFLAWLTCLRGDARAQYSAWLALLGDLQPFIPKGTHLDAGPRSDLFALALSLRAHVTGRCARRRARATIVT